eukprot:768567-Hanusia_phi.AAC.2
MLKKDREVTHTAPARPLLSQRLQLRSLHGDAAAAQKEVRAVSFDRAILTLSLQVLEELAKEVGGTPPVQAGISTGSTKKSKGGGWLGLKGK